MLQDIIDVVGQPIKKNGSEYEFRCPVCSAFGGDTKGDNLKYNANKNVLYCFANSEHAKDILREINRRKRTKEIDMQEPQYKKCQKEYVLYQQACNDLLLGRKVHWETILSLWENDAKEVCAFNKSSETLNYLYRRRGINPFTVEQVGLGIDPVDKKWVIPIYRHDMITGFEYRALDFSKKKIWREKDTPRHMAYVWGKPKSEKLIICEGFFDAYIMLQLQEGKDVTIATCSNGVNGTLNAMKDVCFNNYKEICLCLDNDTPSQEITKTIIEQYPFVIDKTPQFTDAELEAGNKDITDWYFLRKENHR